MSYSSSVSNKILVSVLLPPQQQFNYFLPKNGFLPGSPGFVLPIVGMRVYPVIFSDLFITTFLAWVVIGTMKSGTYMYAGNFCII